MLKRILPSLLLFLVLALPAFGQGSGGVTGPSSSTNNNCAAFNGTTGKKIKDAGAPCGSGGGGTPANPTATAGPTAINGSATTYMRSDAAPAIQLGTALQKGIVQADGTTVTVTGGVISSTGGATYANPTATAGPTAVNGVSTSGMRSDAAPAIQKGSAAQLGIVQVDGVSIVANGSGVVSTQAADATKTGNYSIAAADMGGQVNFNGTSLTVTFPAISGTVFAAGQSVIVTNFNSSALTISSTPTINGFSGTSIPQFGGISCISNGASLDCVGLGALANTAVTSGTLTWTGTQTFTSVIGGVNTQTGTTYTLQASDCGKTVVGTNASAITFTTFQAAVVGCTITVQQGGAGQITFANGGSATLVSPHAYTKTFAGKGATVVLFVDVNGGSAAEFILSGDGA